MPFSPTTIERFRNARFQGLTFEPDAMGLAGSYRSGRFAVIALRCADQRIVEARFRSFNCISVIAAADWICETLQGQPVEAALEISIDSILQALDGLPTSRYFCAYLAHDALKAAVDQAQKRGLLP